MSGIGSSFRRRDEYRRSEERWSFRLPSSHQPLKQKIPDVHLLLYLSLVVALITCIAGCGGSPSQGSSVELQAADRFELKASPVTGRLSVIVYPNDATHTFYCILRTWQSDQLEIIRDCHGSPEAIDHTKFFGKSSIIQSIRQDLDGLLLTVYDPDRNVSNSASSSGSLADTVSFYRLSAQGNLTQIATQIPWSTLDSPIYLGSFSGSYVGCDYRNCFQFKSEGGFSKLQPFNGDFDILEISASETVLNAIVRNRFNREDGNPIVNPQYRLIEINQNGHQIRDIPGDCIPFQINQKSSTPYRCARTGKDFMDLISFEIEKFNHQGLLFFGASNREGRIPWSQYYYLTAFASILSGRADLIARESSWTTLRKRTCREIELIAARAQEDLSGYQSNRYSLNRAPLLFALHLGRIGTILSEYRKIGCTTDGGQLVERISREVRQELIALEKTVEEPWKIPDPNSGEVNSFRYRKGIAFWSDGANLPYNFISGINQGVIDLSWPAVPDANLMTRLRDTSNFFVQSSKILQSSTWSYWWGLGYDGWSTDESISMNTPAYVGFKRNADISYRIMDANAILAFSQLDKSGQMSDAVRQIRSLVAAGKLPPEINDRLVRVASPAAPTANSRQYFSRAALPEELGSLVWALESTLSMQAQ
jgi:hypothetical protein